MASPYDGLSVDQWEARTRELIEQHPLEPQEVYDVVLQAWNDIFQSGIGSKPFRIGVDIFPTPQIMGFLLHELIPLEFANRYPGVWRRDATGGDKDLVFVPDVSYSVEIKTSSNPSRIFGNRSYAQDVQDGAKKKKEKTGYYIAVNFGKFNGDGQPVISKVRFGWLDHADWAGQKAQSGQQSNLSLDVEKYKLLRLPLI